MGQSKTVILVVAIALVIVAVIVIFKQTTKQPQSVVAETWFACTACEHYFHHANERPPIECLRCGEQTAWPALRCTECGKVVGIDRRQLRAEGRGEPACPVCRTATLRSIRDSDHLPPSEP